MPFYESFDEFRERMGCAYIQVQNGFLFENGAFSDFYNHSDPPDNKFERLLQCRKFYAKQLDANISLFNRAKEDAFFAARMNGRSAPTITQQHIDNLTQLRDSVMALREKVSEFDNALQDSPEAQLQRQREADEAERLAELARLKSLANQINI